MKAVVMCAGFGTRMRPLTEKTQKVLLNVGGKPFLYYLLTNLKKAGIKDIALVVGYKKEHFRPFLEEYGFNATLIDQDEQIGTGHAIKLARDFVGDEDFVVMGGDNLWSVEDLKDIQIDDEFTYVTAQKHLQPEQYGVFVVEGDYLVDMPEKPKEFISDLINTGLYKFTPEIFDALEKIDKSPRGEYEINDAIKILAKGRKVRVIVIKNYWKDFGKPEDIPILEKFFEGDW